MNALKQLGILIGAAMLFLTSCAALLRPAMNLADPMTHRPLGASPEPFPVLIVSGETARVEMLADVNQVPAAPPGSTYLVPAGKAGAIMAYLRAHEPDKDREGGWTLEVDEISPGRQRIELLWFYDGFSGGVYEAEAGRITPRYRKLTGPGFAFVFGPLALAINTVLWVVARMLWRRFRRKAAGVSLRNAASA